MKHPPKLITRHSDGEVTKPIAVEVSFGNATAAAPWGAPFLDPVGVARRIGEMVARISAMHVALAWRVVGLFNCWRRWVFAVGERGHDQSSQGDENEKVTESVK